MGCPRAFFFISRLSFRKRHDFSFHLSARPLTSDFFFSSLVFKQDNPFYENLSSCGLYHDLPCCWCFKETAVSKIFPFEYFMLNFE